MLHLTNIKVRLSIKIILFPVDRPSGSKRCDWRIFFSILQKKKNLKMDNISMENKKKSGKKKIAAARLASILATRWTGNRIVFMDSLRYI